MSIPLQISAAGEREIVITRDFDAPRELVFRAWTEPALVTRWMFGPPGWSFAVCEIDFRVGGSYRLAPEGDIPASTVKDAQRMFITPHKHPITAGIAPFRLTDETYKRMWIAPDVQPLLTCTFSRDRHELALAALRPRWGCIRSGNRP